MHAQCGVMSKAKARAKAKAKAKDRGMPRFVPTDEDRAIVKLLIANGYAQHLSCRYISTASRICQGSCTAGQHGPPRRLIDLATNLRRLVVLPS
jgi:hypothetical protein